MTAALQTQLNYAKTQGWLPFFTASAARHGVPLSVLLAVASRETGIGSTRAFREFTGDNWNGIGIMQIDKRWHKEFTDTVAPNDHAANIDKGASVLAADFKRFKNWPAAVSAYNSGAGNVIKALKNGLPPDAYTTGKNYATDVLARARFFESIVPAIPATKTRALVAWAIGAVAAGFVGFIVQRQIQRFF